MRPPGWWKRRSRRTQWILQHYSAGLVILPSLAVSVLAEAWPSIVTNGIIILYLVFGDVTSRNSWVDGHNHGVLDSLEAMRHAESADEYGRLATSFRPPWQDRERPPVAS